MSMMHKQIQEVQAHQEAKRLNRSVPFWGSLFLPAATIAATTTGAAILGYNVLNALMAISLGVAAIGLFATLAYLAIYRSLQKEREEIQKQTNETLREVTSSTQEANFAAYNSTVFTLELLACLFAAPYIGNALLENAIGHASSTGTHLLASGWTGLVPSIVGLMLISLVIMLATALCATCCTTQENDILSY